MNNSEDISDDSDSPYLPDENNEEEVDDCDNIHNDMRLYDDIKIDEVQECKYISNYVATYDVASAIFLPVKMDDLKKEKKN